MSRVYVEDCLYAYMTLHGDSLPIQVMEQQAVWRRETPPRGKPLALSFSSSFIPSLLASPIPSLLQAFVTSLSFDSEHVNEDVMRLTDMQLI